MPNGAPQRLAELLSAPLEQLLVALASGVGRAQAELDRHSIETQRMIDEDPVLAQYGLEATWYQMPSTQFELKVAVAMEGRGEEEKGGAVMGPSKLGLPRMWIQPVTPRVQNQFSYDVTAASTISLTMAAVPPPGRAASGTPLLTSDQVLEVSRKELEPRDDTSVQPTGRITLNYNPGARAWYVVQTREEEGKVLLITLVKVEDESGAIVQIRRGEE